MNRQAREELFERTMKDRVIDQQNVCDLQDFFGMASVADLQRRYEGYDAAQRQMFLWIAFRVLSVDEALRFLHDFVLSNEVDAVKRELTTGYANQVRLVEEQHRNRMAELHYQEQQLAYQKSEWERSRKPLFRRIADMQREIKYLTTRLTSLLNASSEYREEIRTLRAKARKYDHIRTALGLPEE